MIHENKDLPAYPITLKLGEKFEGMASLDGFSKRELAFFITLGGCISLTEIDTIYSGTIIKLVLSLVDAGFEALDKQPAPDTKS